MKAALYTSRQAARISGLSLRQLSYWRKIGFLAPSHRTPGGHSRYTFHDLIALKSARQLLDAGVSLQKIRASIEALRRYLPSLQHPLAEISLVATGDVIVVLHGEHAFEALSGQQWIFPIARMEQEIRRLESRSGSRRGSPPPQQGVLFPELFPERYPKRYPDWSPERSSDPFPDVRPHADPLDAGPQDPVPQAQPYTNSAK